MVRIRLRFDSTPVHYARQCWFLFDPSSCRVVGDVAFLIAKHFGLEGIQLYMDDFLVPANEGVEIIRDNDTIQVKAVASSPHHGGTTTANSSWIVDQSEESPAKRAKLSTSPRPVKRKTSKKNKHKKRKVKKHTEDASKKQKEEDTEVTAFFMNLLNKSSTRTPLRASQLQGKSATTAAGGKDTTGNLAVQRPGLLKAVTKKSSSGGLHTKFCSSSDSEPEEQTSAPKAQQTSTPRGGNASNKSTPRSSSAKRPTARTRSGVGRSSFPSVVGGPSDSFTTKSVIYKRASNSTKNSSDSSSSSSESSPDNKSKKQTPPPKAIPPPKPTPPFKATPIPGSTEAAAQEESASSALSAHAVASGSSTSEKVPSKENSNRDYASLPALLGPPRIGDMIIFKVLELSANCTPEFSDYKEAMVLAYDAESKSTKLKLTETTMKQERKRAVERAHGKLSLPVEDEQTELECQMEIELSLESMIEPKLI